MLIVKQISQMFLKGIYGKHKIPVNNYNRSTYLLYSNECLSWNKYGNIKIYDYLKLHQYNSKEAKFVQSINLSNTNNILSHCYSKIVCFNESFIIIESSMNGHKSTHKLSILHRDDNIRKQNGTILEVNLCEAEISKCTLEINLKKGTIIYGEVKKKERYLLLTK